MADPLVSVIVPTKNNAMTLEPCLRSIRKQSYPAVELIVVDNYSVDDTRQTAKKFTDVIVLKGPERSSQRNYGAKIASGQFVFMIDSDMELGAHVVKACVDAVISDPAISGVVVPEESFGVGLWARCKQLERSFYVGVPWLEAPRFLEKAAYEKIGGYDEALVSGEDWDLSRKIRMMGDMTRIDEYIYHNEGHTHLWEVCRKKFYYAQHARAYLLRNPQRSMVSSQVGPIQRYRLFFSEPKTLFADPFVGVAMLAMKACEFISGSLGYFFSTSPQRGHVTKR
jgi:glycosyltransferase involved in cell wall biosynthesis